MLLRLMSLSALLLLPTLALAQGNIELSADIDDDIIEVEGVTQSDATSSGIATMLPSAESDAIIDNNVASTGSRPQILNGISSIIGDFAQRNIVDSEQVFCYQIATPPENYSGYTLDGMAIAGFCGVIDGKLRDMIISELLNKPEHIVFDQFEDCVVRPQVMLRFMRGIDATDMLISSPCHAVAFFYGGKLSAFNAKPAALVIDNLVRSLLKNKIDFVSPTLFNQLLPAGVAKTEEQKALLQKKNTPFLQWKQRQQEQAARNAGWNKLKSQ